MTTQVLRTEVPVGCRQVDCEIVIPVHNEERVLAHSIERLHRYLVDSFPLSWLVTIVDNASTDVTWMVACRLAGELPSVQALHLDGQGRGLALRSAWLHSPAAVVAYMDVDLSTDLHGLLPLVAPLVSGHSDVAIGTRLASGARVIRGPKREFISRAYNLLLRTTFGNGFSDAQCGFKALRGEVARALVPLVEDDGWFFDTELLVLAERNGLRIHEVPVDWIDDADSRVDVVKTARGDLRGVVRMLGSLARGGGRIPGPGRSSLEAPGMTGQVLHFVAVGVMSTIVFTLLFVLLYGSLGPMAAAALAWSVCAVGNLAANRRYTFAARGRLGRGRHYLSGLALAGLPLAGSLAVLGLLVATGTSALGLDVAVLLLVNLAGATVRFSALRDWVFGRTQGR
jgi:putative flippase GtrA